MPSVAEAIAALAKSAPASKVLETHRERAKRFYASGAWKRLRYEVLKREGGKCQVCGRGAADGVVLHVDHIEPLSKNWERRLDPTNCQVMCADDNLGKSNRDTIDWRPGNRPMLVVDNAA